MFIGISVIHKQSEDIYRLSSINEDIFEFYDKFIDVSKSFSDSLKVLFPSQKIETCELIDKWINIIKLPDKIQELT